MKWPIRFSIWALVASVAIGVSMGDELSDWNQVMLVAMLTSPATPAPVTTRVAAIFQAAVFDAVNGVDRHYNPIFVPAAAPPGTSQRAAAVQAALCHALEVFPSPAGRIRSTAEDISGAITDTTDAVQQGLTWGQNVADQIWAWRSMDGFSNTVPAYLGGTAPGQWRPTPPAMAPGLTPQLATTTPWVLRSPSQFRTAGPRSLDERSVHGRFQRNKNDGKFHEFRSNGGPDALFELLAGQQSA